MAASKRKQDEKHLKILRELGSLLHNKQCFDCHQRGPTYVNMTIGSFVCTSCSGVLRGLNPPHRVKSISMASFTPEEIEFITSRGNEFCRRVWLGNWNPRTMTEPEAKDTLLVQKYERKRWYVDPSVAAKSQPLSATSLQQFRMTAVPVEEPYRSFSANNHADQANEHNNQVKQQSSVVNRPAISTSTSLGNLNSKKGFDLLSDLGVDPFTASVMAGGTANNANANFANFENFPMGCSSGSSQTPSNVPSHDMGMAGSDMARLPSNSASSTNANAVSPPPPPKDKYAALADLDCLFHNNGPAPDATTAPGSSVEWEAPISSNPFATAPHGWNQDTSTSQTSSSGNPFAKGFRAQSPSFDQFGIAQSENINAYHGGGFTAQFGTHNGTNAGIGWTGFTGAPLHPAQQTNTFLAAKTVVAPAQFATWPEQHVATTNPFVSGATNQFPPRNDSNNPFL